MVNNNMDLMDWLRKQVTEADADFLGEAVRIDLGGEYGKEAADV